MARRKRVRSEPPKDSNDGSARAAPPMTALSEADTRPQSEGRPQSERAADSDGSSVGASAGAGAPSDTEWAQFENHLLALYSGVHGKEGRRIAPSVADAKEYRTVTSADLLFILGIVSWDAPVTVDWGICAERLLALGGLWAANQTVKADRQAEVDWVKSSHKEFNGLLTEAIRLGDFNFDDVMTRRRPLRSLIDAQEAFMGMKFLTPTGSRTRASLKERFVDAPGKEGAAVPNPKLHAAVDCARTERTAVRKPDGTQSAPQSKVVVVGGESGSGKTVSVLQWASSGNEKYCVYLVASDLFSSDEELSKLQDRTTRDSTIEAKLRLTVAGILSMMEETCEDSTGLLTIVIDEIGEYPTLLRGLCSIPFDGLRDVSGVSDVMLVAVGTGVDAAMNDEVGSLPSRYHRVHVTSTNVACAVWADLLMVPVVRTDFVDAMAAFDHLLTAANDHSTANQALALAIDGNPLLKQKLRDMATNARLTALVRRCLKRLDDPKATCVADTEQRTMWRQCLEHAVKEAMICFRSLNTLSGQSMEQCMAHFGRSFALACGDRFQRLPERWGDVINKFGMVTDNAVLMREPDHTYEVLDERPGDDGECLCISKRFEHRYSITAAQMALAMGQFGFSEPEWSGAGFEAALADFYWLVSLAGISGATINTAIADPAAPRTMTELRSLLLRWTGELCTAAPELARTVWRVKLRSVVVSEAAAQEALEALHAERFKDSCDPAGLVVMVALNADRASFADVIVAGLHGGAVQWMILLQAKHAPSTRALTAVKRHQEMYKMGHLDELASVTAEFLGHFQKLIRMFENLKKLRAEGKRFPGAQSALLQRSMRHVAECSLRLGVDEGTLRTLIQQPSTIGDAIGAVQTLPECHLTEEQLNSRMGFLASVMELTTYNYTWSHASVGAASPKAVRCIIALLGEKKGDRPPRDAPQTFLHFKPSTATAAFAPSSIGRLAGTAPATRSSFDQLTLKS